MILAAARASGVSDQALPDFLALEPPGTTLLLLGQEELATADVEAAVEPSAERWAAQRADLDENLTARSWSPRPGSGSTASRAKSSTWPLPLAHGVPKMRTPPRHERDQNTPIGATVLARGNSQTPYIAALRARVGIAPPPCPCLAGSLLAIVVRAVAAKFWWSPMAGRWVSQPVGDRAGCPTSATSSPGTGTSGRLAYTVGPGFPGPAAARSRGDLAHAASDHRDVGLCQPPCQDTGCHGG